jgi:alcohol dehydrogenase class IV
VVEQRSGRARLGCLVALLLVVAAGYFAFNIGEVYYRYARLLDAMEQEARFADLRSDSAIVARLQAVVDTLGIPETAARFRVRRGGNRITIATEYAELVELPLFVREFRFSPRVERRF